jgi:hypothetical protein
MHMAKSSKNCGRESWFAFCTLDLFKLQVLYYWFQTFILFWMFYSFFCVIPWRLNFICRRFGTLCLFHFYRSFKQETTCKDRTDREFRNFGTENSDAVESPKRKNRTALIFPKRNYNFSTSEETIYCLFSRWCYFVFKLKCPLEISRLSSGRIIYT